MSATLVQFLEIMELVSLFSENINFVHLCMLSRDPKNWYLQTRLNTDTNVSMEGSRMKYM